MSTPIHDTLMKAVLDYCKHQNNFEFKGSDDAGVYARDALNIIRLHAIERRKEIQQTRVNRKKLRNGKNGRPRKATKEKY